jgi:hypothetical protein
MVDCHGKERDAARGVDKAIAARREEGAGGGGAGDA